MKLITVIDLVQLALSACTYFLIIRRDFPSSGIISNEMFSLAFRAHIIFLNRNPQNPLAAVSGMRKDHEYAFVSRVKHFLKLYTSFSFLAEL